MQQNFFTLGALPSRMKKLGDNIEHLYHTANRTVVNAELVEHKVDGIYVQFGADEYNQIVVTFTNQFGAESDKFVVRGRELATVVDTINKVYKKLISKKFKTMRREKKTVAKPTEVSNVVSNVTTVASTNHSGSADADILVEFILQHYAYSGNLYELAEFVDVPRLYQSKSSGAVSNVVFTGDNITIESANKFSISFNVTGMTQSELRKQVVWALQTVIERGKQLAEQAGDSTEHREHVAEDIVETRGMFKSTTKVRPLREKVNEKALKRYNDAVGKGVDALESRLMGLSPRVSSQSIRYYLKKAANDSRLKLPDTSGVTLAKNLTQYNVELMHTLCATANCKVPPFLQMNTATITSSSKRVIRASTR